MSKSHTIRIQIQAKPRFKIEPEIQNKAEGEEAVLECVADGYPTPEIHWIHDGNLLDPQNDDMPNRKVTREKIIISNLRKTDTGNYGCNATNHIGYVYKDVYVNVLALPPEIIVPPETEAKTVDGKRMTLSCRTFGAPRPIVKWFHGVDE